MNGERKVTVTFNYINVSYLLEVSDGDTEMMKELACLFEEQMPELLSQMRHCLELGDINQFKKIVHKTKSACLAIGVKPIIDKIKQFEKQDSENIEKKDFFSMIDDFSESTYAAIKEINLFLKNI